jgi:two-component system nitrogen regulation response regulator NtrX
MDLLIVDDEPNIRRMLRMLLESEGYTVREVESAEAAIADVQRHAPEVVLLDLMLPGMSGLAALPALAEAAPGVPVVMMSGRATLSDAVEATRLGAFHFIEKPLTPEAVLLTLRGALEVSRARALTRALREELGPEVELVGRTPQIVRVRELVHRVAPTESRVLVTGESGTGKELVATAIHGLSRRSGGPFVRVNSAALPHGLIESELFGHEKGAFTGAGERRRGRFELAHRGTLFLDEVADLGAEAQAKLLRALEGGAIERVGGSGPIPVDVRVIAATHRDLRSEVYAGRFREDLFFRLDVVPIHLPPLRERAEDVPLLVEHALARLLRKNGLPPTRFLPGALDALTRYRWPGNVRELLNIVERLTILHSGESVDAEAIEQVLPARVRNGSGTPDGSPWSLNAPDPDAGAAKPDPNSRSLNERMDDYERALIHGALESAGGSVAEAGRRLRTDRANLYRRMRRLGLRNGEESE